jgi:glucose/arabinose dehydrogenase
MARPSDVVILPDGSLLISDDQGGRVFRVSYAGK